MKQSSFAAIVGLVIAAALFRLAPHPPNFAPIAAMALFAVAHIADRRLAFLVPLAAMFASDQVLGLHSGIVLVYVCMAISVVIGMQLKGRIRVATVAGASVLSSVMFFAITNFGVWLTSGMYPPDLSGLVACYVAAIPFFQNTLAGDVLFAGFLFGGFALYRKIPRSRSGMSALRSCARSPFHR